MTYKKVIALLLAVMLLGLTACGYPAAHPDKQADRVTGYIESYLEGEIEDHAHGMRNRSSSYLVHSKYGFHYTVAAMEVPVSDLGFTAADGADEDTIFVENNYYDNYMYFLTSNLHEKLQELCDAHPDSGFTVDETGYKTILYGVEQGVTYDVILKIKNLTDTKVIDEFADIIRGAGDPEVLEGCVVEVYLTSNTGDQCDGFYDFYLNRFFTAEEYEDVSILHDYLYALGKKSPEILSVALDYPTSLIDNFEFLHQHDGTYVTFRLEDVVWEYHSSLGVFQDDTAGVNEYGITKGSLLDVLLNDRIGNAPLYVSIFGVTYPDTFTNLALCCRPQPGQDKEVE